MLAASEFAACSPHARATLVVHALLADGGGVACCDTIHEEGPPTYAVRLLCRRGPRPLWAALVPSLLLGAAIVLFLRGACRQRGGAGGSRRTMWSTRGEQLAAAVRAAHPLQLCFLLALLGCTSPLTEFRVQSLLFRVLNSRDKTGKPAGIAL